MRPFKSVLVYLFQSMIYFLFYLLTFIAIKLVYNVMLVSDV